MWIFTTSGFISAVYKDGGVVVRSRDEESLGSLSEFSGSNVNKTPFADYPYRLKTDRETFSKWLEITAMAINYPNFKSEIADTRGYEFVKPLNKVWSVMHDVEDSEARDR